MKSIAMVKHTLGMGLSAGLMCFAQSRAIAAVLRVPADFATIQAAVTAAVDEDVILVAPGRYHERVVIENKRITLRGERGARETILDGAGLTTTMLVFDSYAFKGQMGALDGLTLTNANHGAALIIGQVELRNCVFMNNTLPAQPYGQGSALMLGGASSVTDCTFIGNDHGAVALGGSDASFVRCNFERNPNSAVINRDGSPTFTDCRFIDNRSTGDGGAIYNTNTIVVTEPTFIGCEFVGNVAGVEPNLSDGGVFWGFNASRPTFIDCRFERNRAGNGGVIRSMGPTESFIDCTFIGNSADWGGAIYRFGGEATRINRCRFESNTARYGGAVYIGHATESGGPSIIDSLFLGNSADTAGALALDQTSPTLVNCVFDRNTAAHQSGALEFWNSSSRVINCTFTRNTALDAWQTGGAAAAILHGGEGSPTIVNTILWHNTPNSVADEADARTTIDSSLVEGGWRGKGGGNIDADPLFFDLRAGDLRLRRHSPAIDAGDSSAVPPSITTDINGLARFVDGDDDGEAQVDLGAHELAHFCAADLAGEDGLVNAADLMMLIAAWGECADCDNCLADIAPAAHDCRINVTDLLAMITHWGACE